MKPFIPFKSPNHCIILMVLMHIIPMQQFLMDLITNHSFTFQALGPTLVSGRLSN